MAELPLGHGKPQRPHRGKTEGPRTNGLGGRRGGAPAGTRSPFSGRSDGGAEHALGARCRAILLIKLSRVGLEDLALTQPVAAAQARW